MNKVISDIQILRELLRIAWPLMLGNLFFSVQIAIDRTFLSRYDPDTSASALAASMILWLPVSFVQTTSGFVATFVAQYYGARRLQEIGPIVYQALYWSILGGISIMGLAPAAAHIMAWTGHESRLVELESTYFRCLCFSALPVAVTSAVSGFFSGRGDSQIVIWINAAGCLVNAALDWCWIYGHAGFPEGGIEGAGWATVAGCSTSALLGLCLFWRRKLDAAYHTRQGWRWDAARFRQLLKFGVPNGLQACFDVVAWTLFAIMVGWYGRAELSATSNIFVINALFFIPMLGLGQAAGVFVGQRLGENQPELAERGVRVGVLFTLVFMTTAGLAVALSPNLLLWAFESDKDVETWYEVASLMPTLLWYVAVYSAFDGVNVLLAFALRGAGDTSFISLAYIVVGGLLLILPVALGYRFGLGFFWAWNFAVLYLIALTIVISARYFLGPWRSMRVIEPTVIDNG